MLSIWIPGSILLCLNLLPLGIFSFLTLPNHNLGLDTFWWSLFWALIDLTFLPSDPNAKRLYYIPVALWPGIQVDLRNLGISLCSKYSIKSFFYIYTYLWKSLIYKSGTVLDTLLWISCPSPWDRSTCTWVQGGNYKPIFILLHVMTQTDKHTHSQTVDGSISALFSCIISQGTKGQQAIFLLVCSILILIKTERDWNWLIFLEWQKDKIFTNDVGWVYSFLVHMVAWLSFWEDREDSLDTIK